MSCQEGGAGADPRGGKRGEVVSRNRLLPRAWELAQKVAARPRLTTRYARVALRQPIKRLMLEHLAYGLALEGPCRVSDAARVKEA